MSEADPNIYQRLVVGFHGCDRSTLENVILGDGSLQPSENPYDWLGRGIYFWEHGIQRALEFATWKASRGDIKTPAVLGAYVNLGRCFDLTDTWATKEAAHFHEGLIQHLAAAGVQPPANRRAGDGDFDLVLRDLDCAVLNYGLTAYDERKGNGQPYFQTVRGVFVEGGPAFRGAGIQAKSHVQIAVRDPRCILGYFVPKQGL